MIEELLKTKDVLEVRVSIVYDSCNLTVKVQNPKSHYRGYRPITLKSHAKNIFLAVEDMLKKFDKRGLQ